MRLLFVLAICASAVACDCNKSPIKPRSACEDVPMGVDPSFKDECTDSSVCSDHYNCQRPNRDAVVQCCMFADRKCTTEADCCPGQTCTERKECFDKVLNCTVDTDCGDRGDRFCEDWNDPNIGTEKRCRFHTCGQLGECPAGQACFNGECMADLPCEGSCESGKGCVPTINRCQDYSMPTRGTTASCPMTCNAGFIATFDDARNIWDTCTLPTVKCVCEELPGLRSEDLGRFSALAVDPGKALWASTYDGQFGDLAVYKWDLTGRLAAGFPQYVDGVPSGAPKYGPSGARGGVVEPGDDIGRYTDIAVHGDKVYVSYYDATNGNLRFAWRSTADGSTWSTMRVDGETTDTGLYTSVAVDSDGKPGITYFQKGADAAFDATVCPAPAPTGPKAFITAVKYAKAGSATPTATDWTFRVIACQDRPVPACNNCSNVCADPGAMSGGPQCLMAGSGGACVADGGASACDSNTEVCVVVGGQPRCADKYNPSNLQDIPEGAGLMTSLAFNGREAFIAYMHRFKPAMATVAKGELIGVQIDPAGAVRSRTVLDASGDTGYFPDVKINPTNQNVSVTYHDFSSKALKYYAAPGWMANQTPEIVDPGTGPANSGEASWVGTDSAIIYGAAAGQIYVVYQDPTKGDLKLAKRVGTNWVVQPSIMTMGAVGFFADGVIEGNKLFASHARIHARLIAGEPHVDNALLLSPVDAP
ncbi:MAG: hypothetical protein JNK82_43310 [Myxococcaceae bacterium]|nr:hypothetical protein [Myxococcaceae bacterium]